MDSSLSFYFVVRKPDPTHIHSYTSFTKRSPNSSSKVLLYTFVSSPCFIFMELVYNLGKSFVKKENISQNAGMQYEHSHLCSMRLFV